MHCQVEQGLQRECYWWICDCHDNQNIVSNLGLGRGPVGEEIPSWYEFVPAYRFKFVFAAPLTLLNRYARKRRNRNLPRWVCDIISCSVYATIFCEFENGLSLLKPCAFKHPTKMIRSSIEKLSIFTHLYCCVMNQAKKKENQIPIAPRHVIACLWKFSFTCSSWYSSCNSEAFEVNSNRRKHKMWEKRLQSNYDWTNIEMHSDACICRPHEMYSLKLEQIVRNFMFCFQPTFFFFV